MLDRYELAHASEQRFESLSGGQQARFQILLLELSGATLLLLDEPTDNLDVQSAEALEAGSRGVRRHRGRGDPRPLVRPRLRPLPGLRRGRRGLRDRGAGLGRGPGPARPDERSSTSTRPTRPAFAAFYEVYAAASRYGPQGEYATVWQLDEVRVAMADPDERSFRIGWAGWVGRAAWSPPAGCRRSTVDNTDLAEVLVCCAPSDRGHGYAAEMLAHVEGEARDRGREPAGRRGELALRRRGRRRPGSDELAWARRQGFELGLVDVQRRLAATGRGRAAGRAGRRGAPYTTRATSCARSPARSPTSWPRAGWRWTRR